MKIITEESLNRELNHCKSSKAIIGGWCGRRDDTFMPKRVLNCKGFTANKRGRPSLRWTESVLKMRRQ